MSLFFKRKYHPGLNIGGKKLSLPLCPKNLSSTYYKPVNINVSSRVGTPTWVRGRILKGA